MPSAVLKTIGGRTFSFAKLDAVNGIKLQLGMAKLVGSELADLASASQRGADDLLAKMGSMLERVAAKANADEVLALMELAFKKVACDGRPVSLEATFGDNAVEPWQVFIESLKVNLSDFLAVVPSAGSRPATGTPSP